MARVEAPSLAELDALGDVYAAAVRSAVRRVVRQAARRVASSPSVDDLAGISGRWTTVVDDDLLPLLGRAYRDAASGVHDQVVRATESLVAAAGDALGIPPVRDEVAELYLANARNRLSNVSNVVWEHARAELLEGVKEGESIEKLRTRVSDSAELSLPRAEVVARTEVVGASNAGAFDQMTAIGLRSTKEWLATVSRGSGRGASTSSAGRTRPSHAALDGHVIDLDAKFLVGGWPADRPHDPALPPGEAINCRCSLAFEVADDALQEFVTETTTTQAYSPAAFTRDHFTDDVLRAFVNVGRREEANMLRSTGLVGSDAVAAENRVLKQVVVDQGFNGLPTVVDELPADAIPLARGLSGDDAAAYAQAMKTGDWFMGRGTMGDGSYWVAGEKRLRLADVYADGGVVTEVALSPTARTITLQDLTELAERDAARRIAGLEQITTDLGTVAALHGYDAIITGSGRATYEVIVLNRSALLMLSD